MDKIENVRFGNTIENINKLVLEEHARSMLSVSANNEIEYRKGLEFVLNIFNSLRKKQRVPSASYRKKVSLGLCGYCGHSELYKNHRVCYFCWLKHIWNNMKRRVKDRKHAPSYSQIKLEMTKSDFIKWGLANPPDKSINRPSIDRIDNNGNYCIKNIRWLERGENSRRIYQDNIPLNMHKCSVCNKVLPHTKEFFNSNGINSKTNNRLKGICKECYRIKLKAYRLKKKSHSL